MQVSRKTEEMEAESGIDTLELKTGEKIKVLNGACMEAEIKDNKLPVLSGKVGNKNVEVLRDSFLLTITPLHPHFIGKMGYMMTLIER